jgi:hypothetical protein
MIGPFTMAPGGFTHILVAIDKFTKWIEYKPITKLTLDRVVDFISRTWDQISRLISSRSSVKIRASKSNISPLHTQGPMVKSRGRTA